MNFISPQVEQASRSTRTPADILRARLPETDALGNATYFTILARWPDDVRLHSIEWAMIETAAEALEAIKQNERAVLVFRNDPDVPRRDVSEDIARAWLMEWIDAGNSPEDDDVPEFVARHIRHDEAVAMSNENYPPMEAAQ